MIALRAITWNLFHGRDFPPEQDLFTIRAQILGTTHLARSGVGVREAGPGVPELFRIEPERIAETCVRNALAAVGVTPP